MNVASPKLCEELYELSGKTWHEEIVYSWHKDDGQYVIEDFWTSSICPAYDLGYLLRKLPATKMESPGGGGQGHWEIFVPDEQDPTAAIAMGCADTPEDAACKLAIELFKQKVLT